MKLVLFANTDWYLYNFRLPLAKSLKEKGFDLLLISPPGEYGPKLTDMGFRWLPIPMERRSLNPLRELSLLVYLWRLFREEKPALVHGFTIKCAVYGALTARFAKVPANVASVAGLGYVFTSEAIKARILRPLVRAMMRFALDGKQSRLILQNNDDVAMFRAARIVSPSRVRLVRGSGFDSGMFVPREDVARERDGTTVLLAARLLWDKGIREYVEAARRLHADGRNITFLLAGIPDPGNPAAIPEALLKGWHDERVLEWLGHVENMPELYRKADIFVLPSYREGLPKSLIEAAACALPLITTDVPGCREVVTDGENGLMVPARDSMALAAAIAKLADDPDFAAKLGQAARRSALQNFDGSIVVAQTTKIYDELLGPRLANSL